VANRPLRFMEVRGGAVAVVVFNGRVIEPIPGLTACVGLLTGEDCLTVSIKSAISTNLSCWARHLTSIRSFCVKAQELLRSAYHQQLGFPRYEIEVGCSGREETVTAVENH
jgi:hypothetical protein